MAEFIEPTRIEIREELISYGIQGEKLEKIVEEKLKSRVHQAMQGIVYNLNTMHSRAGSQVPFSSINLGIPNSKDAALVCEIFLKEYEKGLGKGEQPIFPNIIFRVKKGVNREVEDPYYYLYKLACEVASKRMNPTFMNIDADFNKEYYDQGYIPATMGCRTYLMKNVNGEPGCKGRGNIAPVTINLPRIGIEANKDIDKFFEILEKRLVLAKDALLHRYSVLKNLRVKDLPFVAGQGLMKGSEGLKAEDSIEPILKQGTWVIGFIGLAETLYSLLGCHHGESQEARELGLRIVGFIREYVDRLIEETKLNWSCYATPAEGLSGKFIKHDKKIFGIIKGVTDKEYYTNSFHIPVNYSISIKDKIDIEAPYHKLCNAGHISYIEVDDSPSPENIMDIINYAYKHTNISYIGVNFHIRYCKDCGENLLSNESKCPKCNSRDIQGISRVTGYLSLDERFGPGKYEERIDRRSHTGSYKNNYEIS
jgi:anaerobic ribonucleoside-triphosphate reductase